MEKKRSKVGKLIWLLVAQVCLLFLLYKDLSWTVEQFFTLNSYNLYFGGITSFLLVMVIWTVNGNIRETYLSYRNRNTNQTLAEICANYKLWIVRMLVTLLVLSFCVIVPITYRGIVNPPLLGFSIIAVLLIWLLWRIFVCSRKKSVLKINSEGVTNCRHGFTSWTDVVYINSIKRKVGHWLFHTTVYTLTYRTMMNPQQDINIELSHLQVDPETCINIAIRYFNQQAKKSKTKAYISDPNKAKLSKAEKYLWKLIKEHNLQNAAETFNHATARDPELDALREEGKRLWRDFNNSDSLCDVDILKVHHKITSNINEMRKIEFDRRQRAKDKKLMNVLIALGIISIPILMIIFW